MNELIPTPKDSLVVASAGRRLTAAEFQGLADVPAAAEWFANLDNPRTRRAYQGDLQDFCQFVGIIAPEQFRAVTRAHVLARRQQLEQSATALPWRAGTRLIPPPVEGATPNRAHQ